MARLKIKRLFPGDRSKRGNDPPIIITDEERYPSDGDALDRARTLLWNEEQRQCKNPRKLPALEELQIECDDGSTMDDATVRRVAPQIRD
jgi:hypothetical protein